MTPRAYEAAKRMAADERTPEHERASAAARVKEYEAANPPRQAPPAGSAGGHHRPVSEERFLRIRRCLLARSDLIEGTITPAA